MRPRLLLVCRKGEERNRYLNELKQFDIEFESAFTFSAMHELVLAEAFNGLLIDLRTKVQSSRWEKTLAHDILEQFPVLLLNLDVEGQEIRTFFLGESESQTLPNFLADCRRFQARCLRVRSRQDVHFNVLLSRHTDALGEEVERTVTLNTSSEGCFVYSAGSWEVEERVGLVLLELENRTPIIGTVRWILPWGQSMEIPGIGVRFDSILPDQLQQVSAVSGVREPTDGRTGRTR